MNNKILSFVAVLLVLVGFGVGWVVKPTPQAPQVPFGTISASNAQSQQSLINAFTSSTAPLDDILSASSSSYSMPTLISGAGTSSITVTGAVTGDFVLVSTNATATAVKAVAVVGQVTATDTVTLTWTAPTSSAFAGGLVGVQIRVLPTVSFKAVDL